MSDQNPEVPDEQQDTETPEQGPKQLREALARAQQEALDGRAAKREIAFMKAGLDTSKPLIAHVMNTYSSDDLSVDAITAFAADLGLNAEGNDVAASDPRSDLQQAHLDRERLSEAESRPSDGTDQAKPKSSIEQGFTEFHKRMHEGRSREEASAEVIQRMFDAGVDGEQGARWEGWSDEDMIRARQR